MELYLLFLINVEITLKTQMINSQKKFIIIVVNGINIFIFQIHINKIFSPPIRSSRAISTTLYLTDTCIPQYKALFPNCAYQMQGSIVKQVLRMLVVSPVEVRRKFNMLIYIVNLKKLKRHSIYHDIYLTSHFTEYCCVNELEEVIEP